MTKDIYIRLLNEGIEVFRPALAREVALGIYEILPTADYDPDVEEWEFPPGIRVRIEKREAENGSIFIAIRL